MNSGRRSLLRGVGLLLTLLAAGCAHSLSRSESPQAPANVVLFLVDDLGWADLGYTGHNHNLTPTIDRLAAEGVIFTSAYSNAPNCAPSRACLLTGLLGPRHGIYTVGSSARGKASKRKLVPARNTRVLASDFTTIPEALSSRGYRSISIGKWHLGDDPRSQGFDLAIAGDKRGAPPSHLAPWKIPSLPEGEKGTVLADRLTDEAVAFIESSTKTPFFLYLSHYAVHTPVQAPAMEKALWKKRWPDGKLRHRNYAAMVDSLDRSLARVVATLEKSGLKDNTLVIFISDNGGHQRFTDNGVLRGGKGMLYEGGVRVPCFMWGPGLVTGARRVDDPVQGSDIFPTLLDFAAVPAEDRPDLDGTSLLPLLGDGSLVERSIFWHFPAYLEPYIPAHGDWRETPSASLRRGRWKLIEHFEDGSLELYDLDADIAEKHNLAAEEPQRVTRLHRQMLRWRQTTEAAMPSAN